MYSKQKRGLSFLSISIHVLLFLLEFCIERSSPQAPSPVPTKFHDEHRQIQWCVNGVSEPEFQKYPFSEFNAILRRKYYEHFKANVRFKYTVDLRPIKIKAAGNVAIGTGGNLHQRAHFVFKAEIRREFKYSVDTYYNTTDIEGLLIQTNYAPLGVGLPTGTFTHPNEFNCVDCRKPIGVPIPCKKRTYMHIMHPTILAYHYQMKIPEKERDRRARECINDRIPSQCIVSDFTEHPQPKTFDTTTSPKPGDPEPPPLVPTWKWNPDLRGLPLPDTLSTCTKDSDCLPQFRSWYELKCCPYDDGGDCDDGRKQKPPPTKLHTPHESCPVKNLTLLKKDVTEQSMPTFECKPFEVTVCRPIGYAEASPYPWETEKDFVQDYTNSPTPVKFDRFNPDTYCCNPPPGKDKCEPAGPDKPKTPTKPCPEAKEGTNIIKTECIKRISLPFNKNTTDELPEPDTQECDTLQTQTYFGKTAEVHGNFVWHLSPCRYTSTVRFLMLVVHSFQRGIYSIVESEDYYILASGSQGGNKKLNEYIPSPLFTGFPHTCEAHVNQPDYLFTKTFQDNAFDYSRSFDECIQRIDDDVQEQSCPGVPKFIPAAKNSKGKKQKLSSIVKSSIPRCDKITANSYPRCESICEGIEQTTEIPSTTEHAGLLKRTPHGAINIITNFCIMPICIFVARFYKETYNMHSYKGQKTWFWMHMVGAGSSTILMYMGFFSKRLVSGLNDHIVLGNFYIICLGLSYVTAWMRHKRKAISFIMETIHAGCGYACFFLALFCITNAKNDGKDIQPAVKILVYVASASLIIFYWGMTIHICSLDRKFGMKPRRLHFPTVEAKFDDLPVPGRNVRRFFLFVLLFVNLPLTIATLFL